MGTQTSNPNLEWKKSGPETKEMLTRKTDIRKAAEYDAKKDSLFKTTKTPSELGKGLKKISKKIKKDAYDDDEEDDNSQTVADSSFLLESNSLLNALKDDEKKFLKQQDNTNQLVSKHMNAGTVSSLSKAQKMMKKAGFIGLKKDTIKKVMRNGNVNSTTLNQTLEKDFQKELNLKGSKRFKNMSEKELFDVIKGVHTSKEIAGKDSITPLKELDLKELGEIGQNDQNKSKAKKQAATAQKICEKTGRKTCKTYKEPQKKESAEKEFEKLLAKQRALNKSYANER